MPFKNHIFLVDWKRFARMFTPVDLRRNKFLTLLYAALSPIALLHGKLLQFRNFVQYRLSINYQVCRLEKLLNDTYDIDERRIYIENRPPKVLPLLLSLEEENLPVLLPIEGEDAAPVLLPLKAETQAGRINFNIYVHVDIVFNRDQMAGLVRQFALASKNFIIRLYV